jgi:uncharacterized membrane protein
MERNALKQNTVNYLRQSEVVDATRFPLIVLVVFIHMLAAEEKPVPLDFSFSNLYTFFTEFLSHNIGVMAVICFFFYSGYFFFFKINTFNFSAYGNQLKKRIFTLLIPYLLWNMINISAIYLKNYGLSFFHFPYDESYAVLQSQSLFMLFWTSPIDYPLWFVRDLMCMSIIAPVFYFMIKYLKGYTVLLLAIAYVCALSVNVPGFHPRTIMFFGAGAYFGIYKKNFLLFFKKYQRIIMPLAIALLIAATLYNGEPAHIYLINAFSVFGIGAILIAMNFLIEKNIKIKKTLLYLSGASFFIYALHLIYITGWVKGSFEKLSFFSVEIRMVIMYFTAPIIILAVCLGIYFFVKKLSPPLLSVLVGGRKIKNAETYHGK